jgi:hypothetical protein
MNTFPLAQAMPGWHAKCPGLITARQAVATSDALTWKEFRAPSNRPGPLLRRPMTVQPHLLVTLCVIDLEIVRVVHNRCGDDVRDLLPLQLLCLSVCLSVIAYPAVMTTADIG